MKSPYKYILSLFLLGIFLFPNIVQLFHHHEEVNFICSAKDENHFHTQHEKCNIDAFHYPPISLDFLKIELRNALTSYYKNIIPQAVIYYTALPYSFQLRAPPLQV